MRPSEAAAVLDKTGYSAFTVEVLKLLAESGWTDLLFCRLDTDTCVLKCAVGRFRGGVHAVADRLRVRRLRRPVPRRRNPLRAAGKWGCRRSRNSPS
jgi:Isochorismatase family